MSGMPGMKIKRRRSTSKRQGGKRHYMRRAPFRKLLASENVATIESQSAPKIGGSYVARRAARRNIAAAWHAAGAGGYVAGSKGEANIAVATSVALQAAGA